jgi:uncharacterized membrane protein YgaE (UPF0421/DUF939 family)
MKMQMQMQLEQAKMQLDVQKTQAQMQAEASKEREQRDADLAVERAKLEADAQLQQQKAQSDAALKQMEIDWQREKLLLEQRLQLATQGLSQGEDGSPRNETAEGIKAMLSQTQQLLMALGQQMEASNRPKRVLRDQNGDIIGLEAVAPMLN